MPYINCIKVAFLTKYSALAFWLILIQDELKWQPPSDREICDLGLSFACHAFYNDQ